jgi:Bifunctional DNA primase/polymerase, N-terminal
MNSNLCAALDYQLRGWSVIPIKAGTKEPALKAWKPFQAERADEATVRGWFAKSDKGVALVCGAVSGGLAVRDFDRLDAYDQWTSGHGDLAITLPTVATARGRHVYFRADFHQIRKLDDGELRGAGYVLAPPSIHPEGVAYRWLIPLGAELPLVDLAEAGFHASNREDRENRECLAPSLSSAPSLLHEAEPAIRRALPTGTRQRHRCLFELARELKGNSALADITGAGLKPIVREWHRRAEPTIGTKPFDESWFTFLEAWSNVKFPKGQEPIARLFAQAVATELPEASLQYEQHKLRLLVAFCRELQRAAGEAPFYLACRTAAECLGTDAPTANRWLRGLCRDGVLMLVERGDQSRRKASRFRYLPDASRVSAKNDT